METQNNTSQIPINTRTVGTPGGIYILYLEDYVHTFVKKLLPEEKTLSLFGKRYEENGRSILVVSGAAQQTFSEEKYLQKYFPSCDFLGTAKIELNKDAGLRFEIAIKNTNVVLDDFYIYYDQNEEMQNYLIEWNLNHNTTAAREESYESKNTQRSYQTRAEVDDAVRYGRIAQAYNREEARVSFMWNIMNVLCLGFVICVMVYGIISINNYQKMQDMQETIDYCMAMLKENMQQNTLVDELIPTNTSVSNNSEQQQNETGVVENVVEKGQEANIDITEIESAVIAENQESQEDLASDTAVEATAEAIVDIPQNGEASVPQYYVVRKGDTLRSICYEVYGNYSMVDEICKWNQIENPDNILSGQKLLLP